MLDKINENNILFLDIETVPQCEIYDNLDDSVKKLWDRKASNLFNSEDKSSAELYQRAGIYAEFGKIVCISVGFLNSKAGNKHLRLKSFYGDDEKKLLKEFISLLNKHFYRKEHFLCAHNGKEFDYPYLARRILINGLKLPKLLDIAGKKPWEVKHLDTLELWKFGDYKHYTSLNLLTNIFNIPSPKDDIDGSEVAGVYWVDKDIKRIAKYCQKDVVALVQLFLRYKGENLVKDENIEIISDLL